MLPTSRFLSFVQQESIFSHSDKTLLAVSGGRDSVLLSHLFNAAGLNFGIAHCNFGLRGAESDADEAFTTNLARSFNVPFHSTLFDTSGYSQKKKMSIQMAARELRYKWFEEIRQEFGYEYVALAHHASDTTETILLNLTRGTGIAGLHGILPKRGYLIRPLMFLSREEIDGIVEDEKIVYRDDSSNSSSKYARNKIRLEVIPKLKELNHKLDDTFEANSKRFLQLEQFLNQEVDQLRSKLFLSLSEDKFEIPLSDLKLVKPRELILYELFKPFNFSEPVLTDLAAVWDGQPGKVFESSGYLLTLDRSRLLLEKKVKHSHLEALLNEHEKTITFEGMQIVFNTSDYEHFEIASDKNKAYFDASLLQFPLKLRQWNIGDCFYPFGMKGKKKLSDFFAGLKIPVMDKKKIPILENGNGDILWVVGYRSDNRYKVSDQTRKIITFEKQKCT